MAWLDEAEKSEVRVEDDKWLKIPDAPVGKTSEVKIRILDEVPEDAWRHWLENRLFNCLGMDTCPVCKVREIARKADPEHYKQTFKMDHRYFFNVLFENKVKVFSFGNGVGRKLKTFVARYGDLRDYDVTIIKRKTGPLPMNVEYDAIYEKERPLTDDETYISEGRYDLAQFKKPASREDLETVAAGELPAVARDVSKESVSEAPKASARKASAREMEKLAKLLKLKNLDLGDFGFYRSAPPVAEVILKLIDELEFERDVAYDEENRIAREAEAN